MLVLDEAHLLNLTVAPAYQGQGYGRALLDFIAHQARSYRAGSLLLEVRPSNHRALHIYQRYGFAAIGTRRGYYPAHNTREDAIVMRVAL
jgi:ribosomal-protein-alanine N-acetyltransferase